MMRRLKNSRPDPEILAAYADGELDDDAALVPIKEQVEKWLAEHPEDLPATPNGMRDLWEASRPDEPQPQHFAAILDHLQSLPADSARRPAPAGIGWRLFGAGVATTAAAVWLAFALFSTPQQPVIENKADTASTDSAPPAAFLVASSDEIEILSVDGAATSSLVVGQVPVQGSLELLSPGDVTLTSVQPAEGDNMMPRVHLKGHETPLIWARVDSEP